MTLAALAVDPHSQHLRRSHPSRLSLDELWNEGTIADDGAPGNP
jgi:hypothetical protein